MYYSQYNQDSFLETKVFKGYENGFFVDVGAHDGISFNNTLFFEKKRGWTGINIEPIKTIYDKLIVNRPNCDNINLAISDKEGFETFIMNEGYVEMLSGLAKTYDARHMARLKDEIIFHGGKTQEIQIPTKRLESIFNDKNVKHINYLSIDVEGAEEIVIKSIDFSKVFIDVIGFENNYANNSVPIIDYLKTKDYEVFYDKEDIFVINNKSRFYENCEYLTMTTPFVKTVS
jgi:FkbM family methyltransferase